MKSRVRKGSSKIFTNDQSEARASLVGSFKTESGSEQDILRVEVMKKSILAEGFQDVLILNVIGKTYNYQLEHVAVVNGCKGEN